MYPGSRLLVSSVDLRSGRTYQSSWRVQLADAVAELL